MKTLLFIIIVAAGVLLTDDAEAQFSRAINPAVGTWHASENALVRGLPARITVERFSGVSVDSQRCKWKSEERTTRTYFSSFRRPAAIIECHNMEEIVVKASTSGDYFQDVVLVTFGDGVEYHYVSAKAIEDRRRSQDSPKQQWGR